MFRKCIDFVEDRIGAGKRVQRRKKNGSLYKFAESRSKSIEI
jgi:hypothetical protein